MKRVSVRGIRVNAEAEITEELAGQLNQVSSQLQAAQMANMAAFSVAKAALKLPPTAEPKTIVLRHGKYFLIYDVPATP